METRFKVTIEDVKTGEEKKTETNFLFLITDKINAHYENGNAIDVLCNLIRIEKGQKIARQDVMNKLKISESTLDELLNFNTRRRR